MTRGATSTGGAQESLAWVGGGTGASPARTSSIRAMAAASLSAAWSSMTGSSLDGLAQGASGGGAVHQQNHFDTGVIHGGHSARAKATTPTTITRPAYFAEAASIEAPVVNT